MERYERYKDSGVKWLGEIPEHWEVKRLGSYFIERRCKVSDKDYAPLSVTKNGIFPQLENVAKTNDGDDLAMVINYDLPVEAENYVHRIGRTARPLRRVIDKEINDVIAEMIITGKLSENSALLIDDINGKFDFRILC